MNVRLCRVSSVYKKISSAVNARHMAERSPSHPALNGVAEYLQQQPMKDRLRAAIEKKIKEMKEEYDDGSDCGSEDESYMG